MAEEVKPIKIERIDNPNGTYTVKEFYEKSLTLAVYDSNDRLLSNEWYKDYECKEFIGRFWREYDKDNSYTEYFNYKEPLINNHSMLSEIKQINADGKMVISKIYSDKNFKKLIGSATFEYKDDGSFLQYSIYEQTQEHLKYLSTINYSNKDRTIIESKLYSDKNYKKLLAIEKREFNENFTQYESNIVYEKPYIDLYFNDNYYSSRTIANTKGEKQIYYYKDKNYSILAKEYNYNEDGSYLIKKIYDKPNSKNCLSTIDYFNKENISTKSVGYSDNNFKNLAVTITPYIEKHKTTTIYEIPFDDDIMASVEYKNDDGCIIEEKHYKDKELQMLYLTIKYEYHPKYIIEKWQYNKEIPKNDFSEIRYIDYKSDKCIKDLCFSDNNFTDLYGACFIKYYQDYYVKLYTYVNPQNGYYSTIKKCDNNDNLVYSKKYKFKGLLAHILFWLAR